MKSKAAPRRPARSPELAPAEMPTAELQRAKAAAAAIEAEVTALTNQAGGPPAGAEPAAAVGGSAASVAGAEGGLAARVQALELELAQKDILLSQGFEAFTQSAERLQTAYKALQDEVRKLSLQLEAKNQELERNLVEREKVKTYLSNIFESLPVGVLVTDLAGSITSVNRAGQIMIGQGAGDLLGQGVNELLSYPLVPAAGEAPPELDEPVPFKRPGADTLRFRVSVTPMEPAGGGDPLGYILNVQDVTLLTRLQEHAARQNRFTAMGEMAANIAHEIRNPLGSIELFASLVRRGLDEEDEKTTLLDHISSAIASMDHIISNVLEYTKPRPVALEPLNVSALLEGVSEVYRYQAENNGVELELDLERDDITIKGDPERLKQVFQNLFLNALQAMTEGGSVTISAKQRVITEPRLLDRFPAGQSAPPTGLPVAELSLRDTGCGLPREVVARIFDPFFSTKSQGTGLGLAIVHSIITAHHGTIDVESRENEGTNFILMFPLVGAAPSA